MTFEGVHYYRKNINSSKKKTWEKTQTKLIWKYMIDNLFFITFVLRQRGKEVYSQLALFLIIVLRWSDFALKSVFFN